MMQTMLCEMGKDKTLALSAISYDGRKLAVKMCLYNFNVSNIVTN